MTSTLIKLLAALLLVTTVAPSSAHAFGDHNKVTFGRVRHGGNDDPRPGGLERIAWELAKRTSVDAAAKPVPVGLADPELFRYPFVVLTGDGDFPPFGTAEREALRRYLTHGGFLLVDDASAAPGGPFDRAARRELAAVLPLAAVAPIPKTHVLYKAFYLLDGPVGRTAVAGEGDGVILAGRLAVAFSPNDLLGAVARDTMGEWQYEVEGGATVRERALRYGINLAMYALCLDYKDDQVHVPFIMKRRR